MIHDDHEHQEPTNPAKDAGKDHPSQPADSSSSPASQKQNNSYLSCRNLSEPLGTTTYTYDQFGVLISVIRS